MTCSRRRSIVTIGLHGESQSLLDAADNDFYGAHDEGDAHAASAVDSGSDDSGEAWSDESEGEPSAKRVDLGSSVEDLGSDAEENYSDAEETHQSPATSPEERSDDESQNQLSALVKSRGERSLPFGMQIFWPTSLRCAWESTRDSDSSHDFASGSWQKKLSNTTFWENWQQVFYLPLLPALNVDIATIS